MRKRQFEIVLNFKSSTIVELEDISAEIQAS